MPVLSKKDLIKYARGCGSFWIWEIMFVILLIAYLALAAMVTNVAEVPPLVIIFSCAIPVAAGIWIVWRGTSSYKKFTECMQEADFSGELQALLVDFSRSHSMMGDRVRLGEKYIFSRKGGYPVNYGQIVRIYQTIQRTNFIETQRYLSAAVDDNGACSVRVLCVLKRWGRSDEDVKKIMAFIRYKNPNVQLGYR